MYDYTPLPKIVFRLCLCGGLYALAVAIATTMFSSSFNFYLLHLGNAITVIFMNQETVQYCKYLYPLVSYATSFVALAFGATVVHILIASAVNVVEQILMHFIMLKFLGSLRDIYLFRTLRFLRVLFVIALPFSVVMAIIGTTALVLSSHDMFTRTLLVYTVSHVAGNYLGLYSYYVLRGFKWRQRPPIHYMRDLVAVCAIEILLNVWKGYGIYRQAATVQIYPLLAYIAARYNQSYTALADVLVVLIVLGAVILKRGPYYMTGTTNLSLFISLFIMLMYSACLTALLSFYMQQRRTALNNVSRLKDELFLVSTQVSHDVRAPLMHITSVCENLQTVPYTINDLEEVNFSCQTISDIMDSWLIILSKSENISFLTSSEEMTVTGDTSVEYMSTEESLSVLLRKNVVYANRIILLSGKPLSMHTSESNNYTKLQFSNKMLQHVLINLISNAVKYSKQGTISVLADFDQTKQELSIIVKDQGIGISRENIPRLFNNFFRIQNEEEQETPGLNASFGIGLAIVKSLILKMHGSITVSSELCVGTEFKITVPCYDIIQDNYSDGARDTRCNTASDDTTFNENNDIEKQQNSKRGEINLSEIRVLIAEDNRMCSFVFGKQLSECASVSITDDGALVLDMIRFGRHEVVMLDGNLPNHTGQQILGIVDNWKLPKPPVIVTISADNKAFSTKSHPSLIVEHCPKPCSKQQLLNAITTALKRQQKAR